MVTKLHSVSIVGLQGYVDLVTFYFNDGLTMIKGSNSAGKSAIKRILKAYQKSSTSEEDLRGLLNLESEIGVADVVVLKGDEYFTMRYCIYKDERDRLKEYYEIYDNQNTLIHRSEQYEEIIAQYIGFESILEPGGSFPLNFKDSTYNAFINSSDMTNSYILDGLCYIGDYETRIGNIKDAIVSMTDIKREYTKEIKLRTSDLSSLRYIPTDNLKLQVKKIENISEILESNYKMINLLTSRIEVLESEINNSMINSMLDILNKSSTIMHLNRRLELKIDNIKLYELSKIGNSLGVFSSISNYLDNNSLSSDLEKVTMFLDYKRIVDMSTLVLSSRINDDKIGLLKSETTGIWEMSKIKSVIKSNISGVNNENRIDDMIFRTGNLLVRDKILNSVDSILNLNIYNGYYKTLEDIIEGHRMSVVNEGYLSGIEVGIETEDILKKLDRTILGSKIHKEMVKMLNCTTNINNINNTMKEIPQCPTCGRASL